MLAEDGLQQHVLLLRGGVCDQVVCASLLAARHKKKVKLDEKGASENHDSLLGGPGKCHICVVVHPVRAETELALSDAGPEAFLGIRETECAVLGHKGGVDIVHILGDFHGERTASGEA